MRKLTLVLASVFAFAAQAMAHGNGYTTVSSYADAFVFDEMGVTFSVYPDGEFDFYLPNSQQTTTVSNGFVNATFNSGYDYDPYVQYDDFGAVIQVENVPVWYDYYGRVNQIGDVMISYRDSRIYRVGGLQVYYNGYGNYAYYTGFINMWNPYFVYRPFYVAFARPSICFVHVSPYRQYYTPVRYTYYRPYAHNVRPSYATIGHTYSPNGHGQAHYRYTQTAGRGEVAVVRSRQTITTADVSPRPSTVNHAAVTDPRTAGNATSARANNGTRQTSEVRQAPTNATLERAAQQTAEVRRPVATQPRTVQAAPARTNEAARVASSTSAGRAAVTPQSHSNASAVGVSRSSSSISTQQAALSRGAVNTAPSRNVVSTAPSSNRTSMVRTQPSSTTRSAVSQPAPSSSPRVTTTQSSRSAAQTPGRVSSSAGSISKGSAASGNSSRRGN